MSMTRSPDSLLLDEHGVPWFEDGERLDRATFHERYLRTPQGYKAELIGGMVQVMSSPLRIRHSRGDFRLAVWLGLYEVSTPGTLGQINGTLYFGDDSESQPDLALLIAPDHGGQTRDGEGEEDYTHGVPELVVETSLCSRSADLNAKFREYERGGVQEYLVHDVRRKVVHWFAANEARLQPVWPDADGITRSRSFPGLWLDHEAVARTDARAMIATLNLGLASPEHAAFVAELSRWKANHDAGIA